MGHPRFLAAAPRVTPDRACAAGRGSLPFITRRVSRVTINGNASSGRVGSHALLPPLRARSSSSLETMSLDDEGNLSWDVVVNAPDDRWPQDLGLLDGYTLRPGQVPAAAPTTTLPTLPSSLNNSQKPVVLIRDTNAWCPFCERVWLALEEKNIPYDSVLIELYNKPTWYKDLVPTSLVPAVAFTEDNSIVWESKDILLSLEERFPQAVPLLPTDDAERQAALELLAEFEDKGLDKAGYAFMTGGRMMGRSSTSSEPPPDMESLRASFIVALEWFERVALARYQEGPYLLGAEISVLDIMAISAMERLAAGLPRFRGFQLRNNPDYPATAAWFAAISSRPAYQRVCSDDQTLQLLFQRMMGLSPAASAAATAASGASAAEAAAAAAAAFASHDSDDDASSSSSAAADAAARTEAYDVLSACCGKVIKDVLEKSGITRYQASPYGATTLSFNGHRPRVALPVREAVEQQVLRVMKALLLGSPGAKPSTSIAAAFGAVAATYLRARPASCGDLGRLSPSAAAALATACTATITQSYADGVEALPFVPPEKGTPAAAAAAEAAMKITANKAAIVDDIMAKSGLARPSTSTYGSTYMSVNGNRPQMSLAVRSAVEFHLDKLCGMLLTGEPGPKAEDDEAAAVGAAALAFFRNRASAPRDMSAAATVQFRAACDAVLAHVY